MITRKHMAIINSSFNLSMSAGGHAMSSLQMHARVKRASVALLILCKYSIYYVGPYGETIKNQAELSNVCVFVQTVPD